MSRDRFTASARHRMPLREKRAYDRLAAPPRLWRCCEPGCGVKCTAQDQAGHAAREHGGNCRWVMA